MFFYGIRTYDRHLHYKKTPAIGTYSLTNFNDDVTIELEKTRDYYNPNNPFEVVIKRPKDDG